MINLDLEQKHALVCGASQGIGRATATLLAELGAEVTVLARSAETLAELAETLPTPGKQQHRYLVADFNAIDTLDDKIRSLVYRRPIHILINNTGGPKGGPLHQAELEEFSRGFAQHVLCNQILLQAVLPGMREAGYGRVINVISTSVKQPIPGLGVSNTIRGAVANWAKTLAGELGPDGITVNNVLPGFTETPRLAAIIQAKALKNAQQESEIAEQMRASVPLRRFAQPEETAAAIAFLASPAAGYINGVNLPVDGGRLGSL